MAQPNNNNNHFNIGERNSGGNVVDINRPCVGVRNNAGNIIIANCLDQAELVAQTTR